MRDPASGEVDSVSGGPWGHPLACTRTCTYTCIILKKIFKVILFIFFSINNNWLLEAGTRDFSNKFLNQKVLVIEKQRYCNGQRGTLQCCCSPRTVASWSWGHLPCPSFISFPVAISILPELSLSQFSSNWTNWTVRLPFQDEEVEVWFCILCGRGVTQL